MRGLGQATSARSSPSTAGLALDTPLAQILEIPELLNRDKCRELICPIDRSLVPSIVTTGIAGYRTSTTCHLSKAALELRLELDRRFAALFGAAPDLGEPLQGQRYNKGQYFQAHTDWFTRDSAEYEQHARITEQRTWTLMVYLIRCSLAAKQSFRASDVASHL